MERVLYNTILGAWPIQADGTSFYYSDYANTGKKVWYRDKWPCCSGTFPQLAADYHISTYLQSADGVYVNLFTPSTVQWEDGGGRYGLKQETQVSLRQQNPDSGVGITAQGLHDLCTDSRLGHARSGALGQWKPNLRLSAARNFWQRSGAPGKMAIASNSNSPCRCGSNRSTPITRTMVALVQGPLVLFAVADSQPTFDKNGLLQAKATNNKDWRLDRKRGRWKQCDHASIHEHRQGELQHVRAC